LRVFGLNGSKFKEGPLMRARFACLIFLSMALAWPEAQATIGKSNFCGKMLSVLVPKSLRLNRHKPRLETLSVEQEKRRLEFETSKYYFDRSQQFRTRPSVRSYPIPWAPITYARVAVGLLTSTEEYKMTFFGLLQDLEREVLVEFLTTLRTEQDALLAVLERYESAHGFEPAVELPDKFLSDTAFSRILSNGSLFNDPTFDEGMLRAFLQRYELFMTTEHGYFTHRIQWNVVMRFMESRPDLFHGITAPELFKSYGNSKLNDLVREQSFPYYGLYFDWLSTFDEAGVQNFSSPEFLRRINRYIPEIFWR
jgi:hypothetical protein